MNDLAKVQVGLKVKFTDKSLNMKVKGRLYEGEGTATALYGADKWSIGAGEKKIESCGKDMSPTLRSMCGVTRMDKIRNEQLRKAGVTRGLAGLVGQYYLRWFGHL